MSFKALIEGFRTVVSILLVSICITHPKKDGVAHEDAVKSRTCRPCGHLSTDLAGNFDEVIFERAM